MVEDGVLDGLVDGLEISRLDDGELFRFRIGIDKNGETRIGATDISNQDWKFHDAIGVCRSNHKFRPQSQSCCVMLNRQSARSKPFFCTRTSAVARFKAIGMS